MTIPELIVSVLVLVAALCVVLTAVALWRAPDALSRINVLGVTVAVACPLMIVAHVVYDSATAGFDWWQVLRALVAIAGLWVIASVGSFVMGRSVYGISVADPGSAPSVPASSEAEPHAR